jgi:hypothetical protein
MMLVRWMLLAGVCVGVRAYCYPNYMRNRTMACSENVRLGISKQIMNFIREFPIISIKGL